MKPWRNADGKRVCDVSSDGKVIVIERDGCKTRITASKDGTFRFENLI